MFLGLFKRSSDHAGNVACWDWGESAVCIERCYIAALTDEMGGIKQPLRKERDAKMDGGNTGPCEHLLCQPMLRGCRAVGKGPRLFLRHVDDEFELFFFRRLCEDDGRFHKTISQGKDEVCARYAFESSAHVIEVQHVADHHLRTQVA